MAITGVEALLDMLSEFGVEYIFGNPGSTELPLNDALAIDDRFEYILGLQEVPVMAIADGYSMASRKLGVVNLHICCGLGNAMGMLYNAYREGTPLLVTAGQQDRRLMFEEPILGGDMVSVARPWTKWSVEVQRIQDLPSAIRRAARVALTPPTGPVFMALPVDLQMELADDLDLSPIKLIDNRVRPPQEALRQASALLLQASSPLILAGSRVNEAGGCEALVQLAELLGAPVISESGTTHGRLVIPPDHPLYIQGGLPLWSPDVLARLEPYDVVFVAGMDMLRQYIYHEPSCPIPEHVKLIHLDEDPWQIGKNYQPEVGLVGHTREGLEELVTLVRTGQDDTQRAKAEERSQQITAANQAARNQLDEEIDRQRGTTPLTPLCAMEAIARVLPAEVAVVEEAVTTTNTTLERLGALKTTTGYFGHRGWALGWGLGVSIGVQMAWPERPVIGILGEGAAMYGIQGLWTAARYQVPVTFVICNNAQYHILKLCARTLQLPQAQQGTFKGLDIVGPEIDFVSLARSLGVEAHRVEDADSLSDHIREGISSDKPLLLDVSISRGLGDRLNYG
jgi:benzoylformate decarboxylase